MSLITTDWCHVDTLVAATAVDE